MNNFLSKDLLNRLPVYLRWLGVLACYILLLSTRSDNAFIFIEGNVFLNGSKNINAENLIEFIFNDAFWDHDTKRITRPISQFLVWIDANIFVGSFPKLEASFGFFSLILIINFIFLPIVLYKISQKMKIEKNLSFLLIIGILLSPAFTNGIWTYVRLAKPLALFGILLCGLWSFNLSKSPRYKKDYFQIICFFITTVAIMLCDETGLLIFPFILLINPSFFKKILFAAGSVASYTLTFFSWLIIFPWIIKVSLSKNTSLLEYTVLHEAFKFTYIDIQNFLMQIWLALSGSLGLYPWPNELQNWGLLIEAIKYLVVIVLIYTLLEKKTKPDSDASLLEKHPLLSICFWILLSWLYLRPLHPTWVMYHYHIQILPLIHLAIFLQANRLKNKFLFSVLWIFISLACFDFSRKANTAFRIHDLGTLRTGINLEKIATDPKNNKQDTD